MAIEQEKHVVRECYVTVQFTIIIFGLENLNGEQFDIQICLGSQKTDILQFNINTDLFKLIL